MVPAETPGSYGERLARWPAGNSHCVAQLRSKVSNQSDVSPLRIPRWLDQVAAWSWRLLLFGAALLGFLWIFSKVQIAVVPTVIAIIIAATLHPLICRLTRVGVPRLLATVLPLLGIALIVIGGIWFAGEQAASTLASDEVETDTVRLEIERWLMTGPLDLTAEQIEDGEADLKKALIGGARSFGADQTGLILTIGTGGVLVVVLTFLFAKDGSSLWSGVVQRINPVRRDEIDRAGQAAARTMAAYMRSVAITGFFDALLIGIGLVILGVPMLVPLMLLTFFGAFFPLVGAFIAGMAAAIVALIMVGPQTAIWVIGLTLIVQQVEGNVVMPLIMGRTIDVHPVVILLSLTAGGAIAGLPGAFLAVPLVTGAMTAISVFREEAMVPFAHIDSDTTASPEASSSAG